MSKKTAVKIRKAILGDVSTIQRIINEYARNAVMLPRSLQELYENLRDFYVAELGSESVVGCCALHITWAGLGEVKSLAVVEEQRGKGIGKLLVKECLREAKRLGLRRVFALTTMPEFFTHLGFRRISRNRLPHKVWTECVRCPYFPDCPEQAVIIPIK